MASKKCCHCKEEVLLTNFGKLKSSKDGLRYNCGDCIKKYCASVKEHIKAKNKEYFEANKEAILAKNRQYRIDNKEAISIQRKGYRARNQEHIKQKNRAYLPKRKLQIKLRRKVDKGFQLTQLLRTRMHKALKDNVNSNTVVSHMNCSIDTLREWLEFQFDEEMNWNNLGTYWEVDHILPIAQFDLSKKENQEICFNWTNLQPLYKMENKFKSKKLILHYYFNSIVSVHRFIIKTKNNTHGYQSINKSLCWLREKLRYGKNPTNI